ncbi:Dynamin-3, partial [Dissostichus eleginoides]
RAYLLGIAERCVPILLYQLGSVPTRRCQSPRLVIGRSGALGEDCVGLGSFPCSDYPGLLSGNGPLPLGPSPPPLPPPPLRLPHLTSPL